MCDCRSFVCSSDCMDVPFPPAAQLAAQPEYAAIIIDVGLGLGLHEHARAQDQVAAEFGVERIAHVGGIAIESGRVTQEEGQHRRAGELLEFDPLDAIVVRLAVAEQKLAIGGDAIGDVVRSEEHTSEIPSLMRISYAVFCLKTTKYMTTKHRSD